MFGLGQCCDDKVYTHHKGVGTYFGYSGPGSFCRTAADHLLYEAWTSWAVYAAGVCGWPTVSAVPYYQSVSKFRMRKWKFFEPNSERTYSVHERFDQAHVGFRHSKDPGNRGSYFMFD